MSRFDDAGCGRILWAVVLALLLAAPVLAATAEEPAAEEPATDESAADESAADESATDESGAGEPKAVIYDEVFVESRVAAIPTSNTVAAKLPLALRETPASVAVVESQLSEEQYATTVGEALENVSGLNLQPGSGTFDFFVLRGLDSISGGLILTDGAPEPETTSYHLYNVERVEVFKGPTAFIYGGSPLAGTVNLVRKQPLGANFVRFGATAGSFATWEATVDANLSTAAAGASFRVNALHRQSDHYRDQMDSETWAVNPALTWRPSDRTSVNFNFEHVDLDYHSDHGLPLLPSLEIPDVPRTRSYQTPYDLFEQQARRFQIDLETHLSERTALRNKTFYRELDWYARSTRLMGVYPDPSGTLQVSRMMYELDDLQEFVGNQFELLWRLGRGPVRHTVMAGLELAQHADEYDFGMGFLPSIALYEPVETAGPPVLFPLFGADARSRIAAPYLVDQISWGEKLRLLLGARYDTIDFEDQRSGSEREDEQLSPMLGLVVLPTATLSVYANLGQAFAPPSTFVTEERVPEESRQVEVGVKKSHLGGKAQTTLALYQIERENIAIPDQQTGVLQQTGNQRSRGLELELSAEPRPGLRTFVAYAWTDAELTEFREAVPIGPVESVVVDHSGNTPAFTPEHLFNFWISKRLASGWGFGGGGRWVSGQFIDEDNAFELDGYFVLNAALYYARGPWRLHLNVKNLTGEEYFTRTSSGQSLIPQPGATFYAGFQYSIYSPD